jgi:CBS domain-containing protein
VTERDFIEVATDQAGQKKVADLMTPEVITATPGTTLGDAAKIMVRNSFRRLPIVSEGRLVGMVTTRTLINFIGQNGAFERIVKNEITEILETRVSEVMSHSAATVERGSELMTAIDLMVSTKEGTVCVVEGEKLAGILTERDVARSIAL